MAITLEATLKDAKGKGVSRRLRREGKIPGIIYGGNAEPVAIVLDHEKVNNWSNNPEFYSEVLSVVVDGKEEKVKVQALQRHAFKPKLLHVDFKRV
ncbi:50S ribosomal protein L25 [Psittacicella hinzii]|uniref:Large ribosomal subunit protein bL25 n=1 Tax=Psittacicella hinzii TaxID=2028575 RepID=A0A3A1YNP0_9GAMM|nr:50S ribosomal protein L25 [Psittacicella hinzii]RIY38580.1 50S ribosomal protein L25 [Psittacicella hinzii]